MSVLLITRYGEVQIWESVGPHLSQLGQDRQTQGSWAVSLCTSQEESRQGYQCQRNGREVSTARNYINSSHLQSRDIYSKPCLYSEAVKARRDGREDKSHWPDLLYLMSSNKMLVGLSCSRYVDNQLEGLGQVSFVIQTITNFATSRKHLL